MAKTIWRKEITDRSEMVSKGKQEIGRRGVVQRWTNSQ